MSTTPPREYITEPGGLGDDIAIPAVFRRRAAQPTPNVEDPVMFDPPATGTEARMCADIARRQRMGLAKYGTTVADNPLHLRAWLQHSYEELLDAAIYTRRAIDELDARAPSTPTTPGAHHG
jgi:hypothetical protein